MIVSLILRLSLVALLLLAPAPPAVAQSRDSLTYAQAGRDCAKLRAYVAAFPNSRDVADARRVIAELR